MQKMKLDLEDLSVESFDVEPFRRARRGTVLANELEENVEMAEDAEAASCPCSKRWVCSLSLILELCG